MNINIQKIYIDSLKAIEKIEKLDSQNLTPQDLKEFSKVRTIKAFKDINEGNIEIISTEEVGREGNFDYESLYRELKEKFEKENNKINELENTKEELNQKNIELARQNNYLSTENVRLQRKISDNKPKRDIADKLFEKYSISDLHTLNEKIEKFDNLELYKISVKNNILKPLGFEKITDSDKVNFYKNFNSKAKIITETLGSTKIEDIDVDVKNYVEKTKNIFNKLKFVDIDDNEKVNYYLDIESQSDELVKIIGIKDKTKLKETLQKTIAEFEDYAERISSKIIKPLSLKNEADTRKIDLYLEYEEKLSEACKQLSIDKSTPGWHRLISKSIDDLKSRLNSLEVDLKRSTEILNTLNITDIDEENAINIIKANIETIPNLRKKYQISEYDDILSSIDALIDTKNNKVSDILSEKEMIIEKYKEQIDTIKDTVEQYKNEILEPLQINSISEAQNIIGKYKEYSNFLGLSEFNDTLYAYQKYIELKDKTKYDNVFEDITSIITNDELPSYMKNLIVYLSILDIDIKQFYGKVNNNPDFTVTIFKIEAIQSTIKKLKNINYLKKELTTNLHNLSKEAFFEKFIKPNLGLIIDLLATVYSYSKINFPDSIEIVKVFHQKPKYKSEFHKIYNELQRFLSFEYDIQLKTVNIFIDSFDASLHNMIEFSDVQKLPLYKEYIKKINNGII